MKKLAMLFAFTALLLTLSHDTECHLFARDRAAVRAQKGDWAGSKGMLQELLIQYPDNAHILYDLGVAAYKLNEFDQAHAYFTSAAHNADKKQLKEQALFNQGNVLFQQKKLQEAIDAYDSVLKINKLNKPAQHNKEVAQKMLDDQKEKEHNQHDQNKEQNDQNKDQNKEENQDKNHNGQEQDKESKKEQSGQQAKQGGDDQGSGQQNKSNAGNRDRSDDNQQNDDRDMNKGKDQEQEGEQGERNQEGEEDSGSKDNARDKASDESQKEDRHDERNDERVDHTKSPSDANEQGDSLEENNMQEQEKEQESFGAQSSADDMLQKLDAHLARVLEEQEKKDADLSKKVIKMQVDKQLAGQSGQNRW